jgi:glycosyltransferase involved in cell wall biosynthesis
VPQGGRVLLFLGRLHPKKNIAALIEAWTQVCASPAAQSWSLAIAGWEEVGYESELKALVAQTGTPRVLFIGPQHGAAKEACLRGASAFVLPSLSEGLPRAVLEAWSYGLPVVMTPECNLPEGAEAGAAIVTAGTVNGLIEALRQLFDLADEDRIRIGRAGRVLVEQKFTWQQVAAETAALYRSL